MMSWEWENNMNTWSREQIDERNRLIEENEKLKKLLFATIKQVDKNLGNEIQMVLGIHPKQRIDERKRCNDLGLFTGLKSR
jgi:hypothetical protein